MLSASERILSILIIILLGVIIKLNFFNNDKKISNESSYYKEEQPSQTQKIQNTDMYKVINIFPRKNPTVCTQGLIYYNQTLFESGGLYQKSTLTHMKWPSQEIIKQINLEKKYFAEGISYNEENKILYQLTYKEKEILLYTFPDLKLIKKIKMPKEMREGWGLSAGSESGVFYATDGSDKIFVFNIDKSNNELILVKTIDVTYNMKPVYRLNELICDGIYIYANVYFEDKILKINPRNGQVMNVYNMKPLIDYELKNGDLTNSRINRGDVLNGIAYIPEKKSFILTGKLWNYYYEIIFI
jgi:glutamine cyclotransferase